MQDGVPGSSISLAKWGNKYLRKKVVFPNGYVQACYPRGNVSAREYLILEHQSTTVAPWKEYLCVFQAYLSLTTLLSEANWHPPPVKI